MEICEKIDYHNLIFTQADMLNVGGYLYMGASTEHCVIVQKTIFMIYREAVYFRSRWIIHRFINNITQII